ncbi:MAG TPA: DUF2066 domain-containing protein [Rhizomicrobium sp.]|nr:DUF2066 domain-containing protein [Rhizomicrobium sp.]
MHRFIRLSALLVALAVSCLVARPAAAENAFEVPNVHVEATGPSAVEARSRAIASGRPVAWSILFRRLTRQQDWGRQPALDDAMLQKVIVAYLPLHERRSTTRYVADVTYTFNPEAVARILQGAGIPYTAVAAKRVLLVPMAPDYSRSSLWTLAFANPRFATSPVPFALPVGDAADMTALSGLNFDTATWENVAGAAARFHATEAVLIRAMPTPANKLQITLKRVGVGEMPTKSMVEVPLMQGAPSTYPAAADAAIRALDEMWKNQRVVDYNQRNKLVVDVQTGSLAEFAALENALTAVPNVHGVSVSAMDIGSARLTIYYMGTTDQLRDALAQAGLSLTNHGDEWQLSQGAVASQP